MSKARDAYATFSFLKKTPLNEPQDHLLDSRATLSLLSTGEKPPLVPALHQSPAKWAEAVSEVHSQRFELLHEPSAIPRHGDYALPYAPSYHY